MLSTGPSPSQLSMANPRQISLSASSGVIYTVPANRKFVGYIYNASSGSVAQYTVTPAGGSVITQYGASIQMSYNSTTPFEVVFVAGAIISGAGVQIHILGIESDL